MVTLIMGRDYQKLERFMNSWRKGTESILENGQMLLLIMMMTMMMIRII